MSGKPNFKRRIFLVDTKIQMTLGLYVVAVMLGIGALYAVAFVVLPSSDALVNMDSAQTRDVLIRGTAVYFSLATAILFTVTLLLTHRIAGPVYVIERCVRAMVSGDFSVRLSLRKRDQLKSLAGLVEELRLKIVAEHEQRTNVDACLNEGDVEGAKELLKAALSPETADEDAAEPAAADA
ncbi:MAG: hypothetical protein V3T86_09055 [Planctomycetota bacterium]